MSRLFSWHCLGDFGIQLVLHYVLGKKQQSCWRVLWVPKGHEWTCWKRRKPTAWHLMPLNNHLGKQSCNWRFCKHKRFDPCKNRSVNICPLVLFMLNCILFCIVICDQFIIRYLYLVICHLASCVASHSFYFARLFLILLSVHSVVQFHPIVHHLIPQCYSLFWYWKCIPGISIPITTTIWQVNIHNSTRLHHLLS